MCIRDRILLVPFQRLEGNPAARGTQRAAGNGGLAPVLQGAALAAGGNHLAALHIEYAVVVVFQYDEGIRCV